MPGTAERFDSQATGFDERAGLGAEAGAAVARAVIDTASPHGSDVIVEIGAGSGEIGCHLATLGRYLGMDSSRAMLDVFRGRLHRSHGAGNALLIRSDAERGWPLRDRAATAVLASRVAHLLEPEHLISELHRVCRPGGCFLVGRVQREPDSPKNRLRAHREQLLRERGITPGGGGQASRLLLEALSARGHARLGQRTVAAWPARTSAEAILRGWEKMTSSGSARPSVAMSDDVQRELRVWARHTFGDLTEVVEFEERYTLDGVRLVGDDPTAGA